MFLKKKSWHKVYNYFFVSTLLLCFLFLSSRTVYLFKLSQILFGRGGKYNINNNNNKYPALPALAL